MATKLIEYAGGCFEIDVQPDPDKVPGFVRRTLTARQLSGRPLPSEQWKDFGRAVLEEAARLGVEVHRVGFMDGEGHEVDLDSEAP